MSGTVYVVGNFKGGVGKTKTVTMLAYESAQYLKERTLVIDMDPQGNATRVLAKTGNLDAIDKSITEGFQNGALETEVITVMENLDIIPANTSFRNLPKMLFNMFPDDEVAQITYLKKLVAPLKEKYDRIYIDVPPTISDYSDNAMLAADYCIIVLQTQELSLDGAQTYIAYMQFLAENYEADLQVLGIIPMMLRQGGRVDTKVLDQAKEMYGGNVLNTIVNYQERLKVYDVEGIHMHKNLNGTIEMWDAKAHQLFVEVLTELNEHEDYLEKLQSTIVSEGSSFMSKGFEPLIIRKQKSSLQDKSVKIKGTNDFGRTPTRSIEDTRNSELKPIIVDPKKEEANTKEVPESFFKATKTAKISPDVLLRLNTLKPFIEELENEEKSTINDMIRMLVDNYSNTRLTNRQREGYNQMYQHLFDHAKK